MGLADVAVDDACELRVGVQAFDGIGVSRSVCERRVDGLVNEILAGAEVTIEASVGQPGFLHQLGDPYGVDAVPPDLGRGGLDDPSVGDFLLGLRASHLPSFGRVVLTLRMIHVILIMDDGHHPPCLASLPHRKAHFMPDLNLDVHIAPMRPMKGAPPQGPGDEPMWSPMSATLIHGQEEAVLVDTLVTFDQVDALAEWIDGFGKRLVGIYITHGHSDHWIGLSRLRERFGDVPGWARPRVFERAVFEATNPGLSGYWQGVFPGEIPEKPQTPDRLEATSIELEGSEIRVLDIGQGDTEHSTIVHVPSIAAVVGGDVVYNEVHLMTAETDVRSRQDWIDNLNRSRLWTRRSLSPVTTVSEPRTTPSRSASPSSTYATSPAWSRPRRPSKKSSKRCWPSIPNATTPAWCGTAPGKPSKSASRPNGAALRDAFRDTNDR